VKLDPSGGAVLAMACMSTRRILSEGGCFSSGNSRCVNQGLSPRVLDFVFLWEKVLAE